MRTTINMKTTVLLAALIISALNINAQTRYEKEMAANIELLNKAEELQVFKTAANKFELIAKVEKAKWLPQYYASYAYTVMTYFDKDNDNRDKALDAAQTYLDKAAKLSGDKQEIAILQAYIYQSRFFISPMARLNTFLKTSTAIEELIRQYPENPRANLLEGIQLFHKPAFLGGGPAKAKPFLEKAKSAYGKQKLKNALDPNWGSDTNTYYLNKCS